MGKAPPSNAANGWVDRGDGVIGLQITGKDDNTSAVASKSMFDRSPANGVYDIEFDTINLAQGVIEARACCFGGRTICTRAYVWLARRRSQHAFV